MGFGMLLWVLCLVPAGAEGEAQESTEEIIEELILTEQTEWEESLSVSEPEEEILIENQASMEEVPVEGTDYERAEWIGEDSPKSDGERIQEAIDSETEVTITLSQNITLSETIRIPSGKTVVLVPEENMEITIFREDGCSGSMFCVEKDGLLILGREGGRLRLHQGEKNQTEHPIAEGEGKLLTEGEVVVFPKSEEAPAADTLTSDSLMEEEFIDDGTMPVSMDLKDAVIEWMSNTEEVYNGAPHTPEILVWAGPILLMKGFDYDVTYDNHVHAGTAEVTITATGFGSCTGSRKTTFTIRQAVPEYQVENQKAESGVRLSDLLSLIHI